MSYVTKELLYLQQGVPDHDNLRRVLEATVSAVVYEPIPGLMLYDAISSFEGTYDDRMTHVRPIALGVALGLRHLHSHNIVHRNILPENIVLTTGMTPKIGDFSCCIIGTQPRIYTLIGTPEYLAPEVILAQSSNANVDWWAFGCLLHEMITTHTPFGIHTEVSALIKHILYDDIVLDSLAIEEEDIVAQFLNRNPTHRLSGEFAIAHEWFRVQT